MWGGTQVCQAQRSKNTTNPPNIAQKSAKKTHQKRQKPKEKEIRKKMPAKAKHLQNKGFGRNFPKKSESQPPKNRTKKRQKLKIQFGLKVFPQFFPYACGSFLPFGQGLPTPPAPLEHGFPPLWGLQPEASWKSGQLCTIQAWSPNSNSPPSSVGRAQGP